MLADIERELADWSAAGLRRSLSLPAGRDFTTNDYLGLSRDPSLAQAAERALQEWGVGSPASRLLRGNLAIHQELEAEVADWLGTQAALLFPSGWQANQALLGALTGRADAVFSDALNHASLIDGCRLSRARVHVFEHGDPEDLERALRRAGPARRRLIVVESVYSMQGDVAPLLAYEEIACRHDAWMVVDEAHAAGVYGPEGAGVCAALGPLSRVVARVITGGKALGVCGGLVAASQLVVDLLVNRGRAFVFTTAPSPATAGALLASVRLARKAEPQRRRVFSNASHLRSCLADQGVAAPGEGPIVPVLLGTEARAMAVSAHVRSAGFDVRAVRPPTVPEGTSRLRLVIHADHSLAELEALAEAIGQGCRRNEPCPRARPQPLPTPLVVAGTDTDVGKTVVSALLLRHTHRLGRSVRYLKPVQTGEVSDTQEAIRLSGVPASRALAPVVALQRPASVDQAASAQGARVEVDSVAERVHGRLALDPGARWILECAGGLLVPFNDRETQLDLLCRLQAPLLLVARSGLGTLNHTLLSARVARGRGLRIQAVILVGPRHADNEETLRTHLAPLPILTLPRFEALDSSALDAWLDENDLEETLWQT